MMVLLQPKSQLENTVDKLKRVLEAQISGRELAWTEQNMRALQAVEDALRLHMAEMERRDGLFPSLIRPRSDTLPAVTRQVGKLRREHHDLLVRVQELAQLAEGVRNDALPPAQQQTWNVRFPRLSPRGLRARGRRLLEALDEHQRTETKLLQENYVQDTGVGD
jgi:hypothetical protein